MLLLRGEGEGEIAGPRVAEITAQQHLILRYWSTLQTPPSFWMSTNSRLKKKKKVCYVKTSQKLTGNIRCYSNVFFCCPLNYDVAFKIINKLKVNNDNLKFNSDFKNHITVGKTPGEH